MTAALTTVEGCIESVSKRLESANLHFGHGCDCALDEAVWIVRHAAGLMDLDCAESFHLPVGNEQFDRIERLVDERISTRKPLAYLIGQAWFAGRAFYVDERVIVPRSHIGDLIADGFGPMISPGDVHSVLDLCTGSGCIAVAMALENAHVAVTAADIDQSALQVAAMNIGRFGVTDRVSAVRSDLFAALAGRKFDLILCNPPYVDADSLAALPAEYLHEPRIAFAACENGIGIIRTILAQAAQYLNDGGFLVLEAGDSADVLEARYREVPFFWLTTRSGQSVVMLAGKSELLEYGELFARC